MSERKQTKVAKDGKSYTQNHSLSVVRKETRPPVWRAGTSPNSLIRPGDDNRGYDVVSITVNNGSTLHTMLIHRPIGYSNLGNEDWILSSEEEYQTLMRRKDNPNLPSIKAERGKFITDQLLANRYIVKSDITNDYHYVLDSIENIISGKPYHEDNKNNSYLSVSYQNKIKFIQEEKKRFSEEAVILFPENYLTMSGIIPNREQEGILGARGLLRNQIAQYVAESIFKYTPWGNSSRDKCDTMSSEQKGGNFSFQEPTTGISIVDPIDITDFFAFKLNNLLDPKNEFKNHNDFEKLKRVFGELTLSVFPYPLSELPARLNLTGTLHIDTKLSDVIEMAYSTSPLKEKKSKRYILVNNKNKPKDQITDSV